MEQTSQTASNVPLIWSTNERLDPLQTIRSAPSRSAQICVLQHSLPPRRRFGDRDCESYRVGAQTSAPDLSSVRRGIICARDDQGSDRAFAMAVGSPRLNASSAVCD